MTRSIRIDGGRAMRAAALTSLSCLTLAAVTPALAQQQPASGGNRLAGIEEVVVTAQKREESLQSAPLAVTALTGNMLERTFATDLRAINGTVPSLVVTNVVNATMTAAISIRGIGVQEADGFVDPAVGVVVDGVYQGSNTTALLDLFDVERIEILRGPQGTLFGANTIGGVVNVITKQPTGEFGGSGRVTVGNHGRFDAMAAVDLPIVKDVLAGKISVMSKHTDGYYTNVLDGKSAGGQDVTTARGYLHFTPNEAFDATLQLEYGRGRNDSPPVVNYADPGMGLYVAGTSLTLDAPIRYETAVQGGNYSDFNIYGGTLTMNWDSGVARLTSITNYREWKLDEWTDQDGTAVDLYHTRRVTDHWQFSQELRGTMNPTENTELLAGVFYFRQNYKLDSLSYLEFAAPDLQWQLNNDQDDESIAGFAQGYWNVTPDLRLQAGVRYTWQEKQMDIFTSNYIGDFIIDAESPSAKESWTHWGWRVGADWQATENLMVYAYQARGSHSGGFNGRANSQANIGPYGLEKVDTYELGLKSDWFDNMLRVNLAGFYNDYKDMQVDQLTYVNNNPLTIVENAASAEIKGVELEAILAPAPGLVINGTVSYLDAKYKDFFFDIDADPSNGQEDATHLALRNAPKWQTSLGVTYEFDLGPGYATLNGQWSYTSRRETDTRNHPVGSIDPLHLVNASVRWTREDDSWSIALWAKNLLDEKYIVSGFHAAGVQNFVAYGAPREVAVELSFNF
ncbi:MAG TPA: TonB-dependent receptor [Sphingomonadales bacterium]